MPTNIELEKIVKEINKDFKDSFANFKEENNASLKSIKDEITSKIISKLNVSFKAQLDNIVKPLREELSRAMDRIGHLENEIARISEAEELNKRKNNIIITGIPIQPQEDLPLIVKSVSSCLGIESPPGFQCFRMRTRITTANAPIVVKFKSSEDKDKLVANYFKKTNISLKDVFNGDAPNARVYINHDLTKKNYDIMKLVVTLRKQKKISQFRISNGRIAIKEKPTDQKFDIIFNQETLNMLSN